MPEYMLRDLEKMMEEVKPESEAYVSFLLEKLDDMPPMKRHYVSIFVAGVLLEDAMKYLKNMLVSRADAIMLVSKIFQAVTNKVYGKKVKNG
jgi:hypothetical protein